MGIFKCYRFGMNEACKRVTCDTWNSIIIKATVFLDVLTCMLLGSQQRIGVICSLHFQWTRITCTHFMVPTVP